MRKSLLSIVLIAVFAVFGLSGCGTMSKAMSKTKEWASEPIDVSVANPAETQGQPLDVALGSFGLTRAHQLFDTKTKQPSGAIYVPCKGQELADCAQHYLTLSSNKTPSVWVKGGKVMMLQGDYSLTLDRSFVMDVPAPSAGSGSSAIDWQNFAGLTHAQQAALLGILPAAHKQYFDNYVDVRETIDIAPVNTTQIGLVKC